ncbi:MAG: OadG family protein [Clostridiaceae bacterium]|nr:OadG family protein [Clostridiaceae bacterium]
MPEVNPILLTLVGIFVVFISLIVLAFAISILSQVISFGNRTKSRNDSEKSSENVTLAETSCALESDSNNDCSDDTLVAVLTAAVLASMGNRPGCKIRVNSFRRIPQSSHVWNSVSRVEYLSEKL